MARSLRGEDGDGGLGASEGAEPSRQGDDEDGALGAWEGAAAREEVCLKDIFGSPPPTPGRIDLEARHTRQNDVVFG
eukprot:tig00000203_g17118.t1